ncbi:MAG: cytochrome c family protein [Litoreibacter sp.]
MFDTMTFTKILGALCGSLLIFLLGSWAAEAIYHGGGGHGDEEHAQGYLIEVVEAEGAVEEEVEEIDFAAMMVEADAAKGEKIFSKCKACHKLDDGANGTGPHLFGVVNRDIGNVDGFGYSDDLASNGGTWDHDALNEFLENPKGWAPGTKMGFGGIKKPTDRANLIAYLETIGG